MSVRGLDLVPPVFEQGHAKDFVESGQTISFALSSRSNSMTIFAAPVQHDLKGFSRGRFELEQDIYFASWNQPPTGERRAFVSDTSRIFILVVKKAEEITNSEADLLRSPDNLASFRKLADDYIVHIQDCWIHSIHAASNKDAAAEFIGDHYRSLYSTFSLFKILYLPEEGIEDVPVGDELLEWLNTHFIEPSTEEGDRLSSLERTWEDDVYWPYLLRATIRGLLKSSTFFLRNLSNHPSENLQRIAHRLVEILEKHPRQKSFGTEKEFSTKSRRWRDTVKALRIELDRVPESDRSDGFENWWENVSDLLGILEGREEVLQRVCVELGGNWKEIVCVYGIWIDINLRRNDLPDIVDRVLSRVPADPTDKEDALHSELCQGRIKQSLNIAHDLDPWLPAHLVDIMTSVGLLETGTDDETGMSIRDYYILSYADYLQSDPGLWRQPVDYLCSCGEIGKAMADELLIRVPLQISGAQKPNGSDHEGNLSAFMDVEGEDEDEDGDLTAIIKELSESCQDHQREPTRRLICQIAARRLVELKKYRFAISYCRSAEDWAMLGRIVESLMEEYITHGPSHYVPLLADIEPSLRAMQEEPGPQGIFVHRLIFAFRYAEFHRRKLVGDVRNAASELMSMFEHELAPRAWWGVLLYDAIPFLQDDRDLGISSSAACLLLRRLEEVTLRTSQGGGEDYLGILGRILRISGPREVLRRLDVLRLALARYLARCTLAGPSSASGLSSPNEF